MAVNDCVFCEILAGNEPAQYVSEKPDSIAIHPLKPVTFMHMIVIPRVHVADFSESPLVTAAVMRDAAELVQTLGITDVNIIVNQGVLATQSVFHLHVHIVPRKADDRLALPWHSGKGISG
jgi:histidine triad (HIT) family protein